VPADPVTRPGDLWLLGPHRLACADATDPVAMGVLLDGQVADCMWTDPPYGVEVVGGSRAVPAAERRKAGKLQLQGDTVGGLPGLLDGVFGVASGLLRTGGAVYVAYPGHHRHVFDAAFNRAGWTYAQELIWVKGHVFGRNDYHYAHEGIIFGYTAGAAIRRNIRPGWWGGNDQNTVFDIPRPARSAEHPSMKPAELVARHLHNSCPPAGLVYDPCAGSGSTLIAAHQLHMRAACAEIDPAYCDVIVRRWAEFTGAEPHREPNGVQVASMATEPA
jgi:DNA modification methylase